ncbi:Methyltransferase domain-containing protein [Sulfobacillus thermosulfidooxidans DSM 9293]|uniref:Methyltransferase domain-containing protein n=1 Tax=Sulfobacillus thermosulfidooxidans (strain DSM 9293 / VKM B-1269 / AT-1) TaxID=929705 RepID=A0A1W1W9Q1_SULTA|nr:class I SAM-dependent methyltransferase [Sulfobacillus thermosulfidooxidans]SMC03038.1 Methyltransferase domain-containing protein [Sulfobacillus thermosulfidooxidans DSM 9293]
METYYRARAPEYEKVYKRSEQVCEHELLELRDAMTRLFSDKSILEVACGTGYWTQFLAQVASHIVAVDKSQEMLQIAKNKNLDARTVRFCLGDAYNLNNLPGDFDGGVANFWLSHVPKCRIHEFLDHWHARLGRDAIVFMADNVYMDGVGGELISKASDKNTYKMRTLEDGRTYEVLKNYYSQDELRSLFYPYADGLQIHVGQCYWWLSYRVKGERRA